MNQVRYKKTIKDVKHYNLSPNTNKKRVGERKQYVFTTFVRVSLTI